MASVRDTPPFPFFVLCGDALTVQGGQGGQLRHKRFMGAGDYPRPRFGVEPFVSFLAAQDPFGIVNSGNGNSETYVLEMN